MLIPPSLLLIIYGVLVEVSIGDLFIAGVVPGLLLALLYALGILGAARFVPRTLGNPRTLDGPPMSARTAAAKLAPVVLLIGAVFGGIYGGLFTPTEAGPSARSARSSSRWRDGPFPPAEFWGVLRETGYITAAICVLFVAATMYSRMLALSGFPDALGDWLRASDLGFTGIVIAYVVLVLVMGSILDSTSIMLICVPLFAPVVVAMGGDLVWFGIVTIIAVEIGLLTPPFGYLGLRGEGQPR